MVKKKISLTNLILLSLERAVETGEFFVGSMDDLKKWMYKVYGDYPKPISNGSLSQAIRRLRQKGLLEEDKRRTEKIVLRLTKEGNELAFLSKDDDKWDGKWRVVVFDIPEDKRLIRDIFRYRLKSWGFVPWQKSVWASKKNLTVKLRDFIKELEISDWVLVIESENVGF